MMAALAPMIPGAEAWPRFTRNLSEKYEARLALVELAKSPSIFFAGMDGARIPVAVAHGEGYADFSQQGDAGRVLTAARYIDNRGQATEAYPFNPNGSPGGLTSVTTADGRFTVMMPHPERVTRNVMMSWAPKVGQGRRRRHVQPLDAHVPQRTRLAEVKRRHSSGCRQRPHRFRAVGPLSMMRRFRDGVLETLLWIHRPWNAVSGRARYPARVGAARRLPGQRHRLGVAVVAGVNAGQEARQEGELVVAVHEQRAAEVVAEFSLELVRRPAIGDRSWPM